MSRSIRWTLLGWYAAILVVVIGALGTVLYVRQHRAAIRRVDAELEAHSLALAGAIEWDDGGFELDLGDEYRSYYDQKGEDAPYFVAWGLDGEILGRSPSAPAGALAPTVGIRQVGHRREIGAHGPGGTRVLVGRGTSGPRQRVADFGWAVLLAGLGALAGALLGGWFLVSRVLAPIRRISETAVRISASNLGARIDLVRTESELGRLAGALNQAFDRLEAAVARQARFTTDASHELRTPLSVLKANVEWALRSDRSAKEYAETLEACLRATDRMGAIAQGLLALARGDADEAPLGEEPLDLAALARDTAAFLAPLATSHEVTVQVEGEAAPVTGDVNRLAEAVTVLVANGIQHNRKGGRLTLRTGIADGTAFLEAADTGPGIRPEAQPHVFERFYRVDAARSRENGGSGLGLAIAKRAVEAHGGEITLRSREGEGTVFTIRLPARGGPGQVRTPP